MKIYHENELRLLQKDVYFFVTEEDKLEKGAKGIAKIRYAEGSLYTGPVEFTGKSFEKIGYGRQDFTESYIDCDEVGGPVGDKLYLYEGMFDYKVTQWIYGDGIFYFMKDGKPDSYYAGKFAGTGLIGEYEGPEIDTVLLPTFRNTKRLTSLTPHKARIDGMIDSMKKKGKTDYLFLGDSYLDFMNGHHTEEGESLFSYYTRGKDAFNAGIGGFRFSDFLPFLRELIESGKPDNLIVNLGFNDLHAGKTPEGVISDMKEFLSIVHEIVPDCDVYFLTVCHFPAFPLFRDKEDELNRLMKGLEENKKVHIIEADTAFEEVKKRGEDFSPYTESDLIHPTNKGYEIWMAKILPEIKGYQN